MQGPVVCEWPRWEGREWGGGYIDADASFGHVLYTHDTTLTTTSKQRAISNFLFGYPPSNYTKPTHLHISHTQTTMSSADAQLAYKKADGNMLQPVESQEFAQQFDLTQPEKAMSSYQK